MGLVSRPKQSFAATEQAVVMVGPCDAFATAKNVCDFIFIQS